MSTCNRAAYISLIPRDFMLSPFNQNTSLLTTPKVYHILLLFHMRDYAIVAEVSLMGSAGGSGHKWSFVEIVTLYPFIQVPISMHVMSLHHIFQGHRQTYKKELSSKLFTSWERPHYRPLTTTKAWNNYTFDFNKW